MQNSGSGEDESSRFHGLGLVVELLHLGGGVALSVDEHKVVSNLKEATHLDAVVISADINDVLVGILAVAEGEHAAAFRFRIPIDHLV